MKSNRMLMLVMMFLSVTSVTMLNASMFTQAGNAVKNLWNAPLLGFKHGGKVATLAIIKPLQLGVLYCVGSSLLPVEKKQESGMLDSVKSFCSQNKSTISLGVVAALLGVGYSLYQGKQQQHDTVLVQ